MHWKRAERERKGASVFGFVDKNAGGLEIPKEKREEKRERVLEGCEKGEGETG